MASARFSGIGKRTLMKLRREEGKLSAAVSFSDEGHG
jgi:hypothetical protein